MKISPSKCNVSHHFFLSFDAGSNHLDKNQRLLLQTPFHKFTSLEVANNHSEVFLPQFLNLNQIFLSIFFYYFSMFLLFFKFVLSFGVIFRFEFCSKCHLFCLILSTFHKLMFLTGNKPQNLVFFSIFSCQSHKS